MTRHRIFVALLMAVVLPVAGAVAIHAYTLGAARWGVVPVVVYVNPTNADVSDDAAEAAVRTGMEVWNTQGQSAFQFAYGGRVYDNSVANDGRNIVMFRNTSNGGALA